MFFFHLKFHTVTPWRWACAAEPLQAYNTPPESALGSVETSRTTRQINYILGARSVHNQPIRSAVAQILSQQKAVNKPPHHRRPNRSQRIVRGLPPALLLRAAQAVLSLGGASRRISVPTCTGSPAMHLAAYRPKSTVEHDVLIHNCYLPKWSTRGCWWNGHRAGATVGRIRWRAPPLLCRCHRRLSLGYRLSA